MDLPMDLPSIPAGTPVFWGTIFTLANLAVTLFCVYGVPAIQKLWGERRTDRQYLDTRADKGFQFVIDQQAKDKEELKEKNEALISDLKISTAQLIESAKREERFKTMAENMDSEIKRLRDQDEKKTVEITESKKEIERLKDHERRNVENQEKLREVVETHIAKQSGGT